MSISAFIKIMTDLNEFISVNNLKCNLSQVYKEAEQIREILLQDVYCSVNELHLLLRILEETTESCLTIDGSCSITQHEGDIVKGEPEIRLKQLTVKANMSSQSLQALLAPLTVGKVMLQQCIILDKGKENNKFTKPHKVGVAYIILTMQFQ